MSFNLSTFDYFAVVLAPRKNFHCIICIPSPIDQVSNSSNLLTRVVNMGTIRPGTRLVISCRAGCCAFVSYPHDSSSEFDESNWRVDL